MKHEHDDHSSDTDESTSHTRCDMLKLAGTVGVASLDTITLIETAVASEARSDPAATPATGKPSVTPAAERSNDAETLSVDPGCIDVTGNPGVTIEKGFCAYDADADAWDHAGYILNNYSKLDDCRTRASVAAEIELHKEFGIIVLDVGSSHRNAYCASIQWPPDHFERCGVGVGHSIRNKNTTYFIDNRSCEWWQTTRE